MPFCYPGEPGAVSGDRAWLHVSSEQPRLALTLLRWGARAEARPLGVLDARRFPDGAPDRPWEWPARPVPLGGMRPGAYVAALSPENARPKLLDGRDARALILLRPPKPSSPLLYVVPVLTYHAYNVATTDGTAGNGEGDCLYSGSKRVTLHRPGGGVGGHPWDEVHADAYDGTSPRQTFAHWDAKAIAWLEAAGFAYDLCADVDLHRDPDLAQRYRAVLAFGHFEYWTARMREALEAAFAAGTNVLLFSGNTAWFETGYDDDARAMWRVGRWQIGEARTTGVSYADGAGRWRGERPASAYRLRAPQHWAFDGVPVRDGTFGASQHLLGYECDGAGDQTPDDFTVLADAGVHDWDASDGFGEVHGRGCATMGLRRNARAFLFTASTTDWARALHAGDPAVTRITRNVLIRALR